MPTARAYAARSTTKHWVWAGTIVLLLAVVAVAWSTFARTSKPPLSSKGQAFPIANLDKGNSDVNELTSRISLLEADLATKRSQVLACKDRLLLAETRGRMLLANNDRMRLALDSVVGAGAAPTGPAWAAEVLQLGDPVLTQLESGWLVSGECYNAGTVKTSGSMEIQLVLDGRPVGPVQVVEVGPIAPGVTVPYHANFLGTLFESRGHIVTAWASWKDN